MNVQAILTKLSKEILERHNCKENKVTLIDIWDYEQNSVLIPKGRYPKDNKKQFKKDTLKTIQAIQFTTSWRNHYIRFEPNKDRLVYISPFNGTVFIESASEFDEKILNEILPLLQL